MIYYNAFGKFVSEKNIEGFADDEKSNLMAKIHLFKKNLETGKINKDQISIQMKEFRALIKNGTLRDEEKKALEDVVKNTVRQMDGINLVGNLELGGIIKARGFHLHDGTQIKEVIKTKDKLAVPIDEQGNLNIMPKIDKGDINIGSKKGNINFSSNIVNLNSSVDVEAVKRSGKAPSIAPGLYVTSTSHSGGYNKNSIAEFRHTNQSQGIGIGYNTVYAAGTNASQDINIKPKGKGVVRVHDKTILGVNSSQSGELLINNTKNGNNPRGYATHFNYNKSGHNYIRGNTELRGTITQRDGEFQVVNPKNGNNPTGWWTHFNHKNQALNYIRGKTEMRGEVNYVDKGKGINISNARNGNNPTGWGTHFNYQGKGLNYLRGKTEMRGEVNYVDKGKGINIQNGKHGRNNPSGMATHFNYKGQGINYIRGFTTHDGELRTNNPKNGNNPKGMASHLNYANSGRNYLRGSTEIRGPQVNVISNNGVKVTGHGKTSTFGSLNSSWCHLITNAPQFYMNKSLQVNGSVSSYSNQPLKCNRGINIGGIKLYNQGGRLIIDAPVEIRSRGTHGGLNIRRNAGDNSKWNYIQFMDKSGRRTAWGGSSSRGGFGSGR
jgi:hypothetical protein